MNILNCEQGTQEWFDARMGLATASRFKDIITAAKGELSKSAGGYAAELVAERLGFSSPSYIDENMQHGIDTEAEARNWAEYELDRGIMEVGLVVAENGKSSCSPDGLLVDIEYSEEGIVTAGIEIKCPLPKNHILWQQAGVLPAQHKAQVHGSMAVTGLEEWYFMSYVQGLPPFLILVKQDGFTSQVTKALRIFTGQVDTLAAKYERKTK